MNAANDNHSRIVGEAGNAECKSDAWWALALAIVATIKPEEHAK